MWQRRGGSAGQLGGMRSTCSVHAGSPWTTVCQPEKEVSREEGREKKGDQEGEYREEERRQCKKKEEIDRSGDRVMKKYPLCHSIKSCTSQGFIQIFFLVGGVWEYM